MKKVFKKVLLGFLFLWVSLLVYPVGYYVLDEKRDVSEFKDATHKKYSGVGVYVINLDRSKERLEYVMPQLQKLGLPIERISAIDGKKLTQKDLDEKVDFDTLNISYKHAYIGAIGCSMSHIKAWETFLKSDFEFAVVFEDDVGFDAQKLRKAIDDLAENKNLWDVNTFNMYLFKNKKHKGLRVKALSDGQDLLIYLKTTPCTGCYILNRKAALKYVEKAYPIKLAADDYYARSWEFDIKFTGIEPCLVHQEYGDSDLARTGAMEKMFTSFQNPILSLKKIMYRVQKHHIAFYYNLKNYLFETVEK
ncbi:MAG: glycosyltransferase family 25 protein [Proteobacteria bacterium]|nr:glycosyltransferase family 25 protein [Pseudomonadota bacterium]